MGGWTVFGYGGDGTTNSANMNLVGEVYEVEELLEGRAGKSFCDGQTSVTCPRFADDNMINLYFSSEEAAMAASGLLRSDMRPEAMALETVPYWATDRFTIDLIALAIAVALSEEVRRAYAEDEVTDSQLQTAAEEFVSENGYEPTAADLIAWIEQNRNWQRK